MASGTCFRNAASPPSLTHRALREEQVNSLPWPSLKPFSLMLSTAFAHRQNLLAPPRTLNSVRERPRLHVDVQEDAVQLLLPLGTKLQRSHSAQ